MRGIKKNSVNSFFSVSFFVNFLLFALKLYIGLSANSISIYSDGINNFFDSLSGLLSFVCFVFVFKNKSIFSDFLAKKTEQLLSFILSAVIAGAGLLFFYNSAERLMYPSPVWFSYKYFAILAVTAVVKLALFYFFRLKNKKTQSDIIGVMSLDSLMDFFITLVTLITLLSSKHGSYLFDAFGGIIISLIIAVTGIKALKNQVGKLLDYPEKEKRELLESLLIQSGALTENASLEFSCGEEQKAYLKSRHIADEEKLSGIKENVLEKTGIKLYIIKEEIK